MRTLTLREKEEIEERELENKIKELNDKYKIKNYYLMIIYQKMNMMIYVKKVI